jgi:hypothetical protein
VVPQRQIGRGAEQGRQFSRHQGRRAAARSGGIVYPIIPFAPAGLSHQLKDQAPERIEAIKTADPAVGNRFLNLAAERMVKLAADLLRRRGLSVEPEKDVTRPVAAMSGFQRNRSTGWSSTTRLRCAGYLEWSSTVFGR